MHISKFVMPEIIFGKGSIKQAGDACLRLGAKKVLIVSDKGVTEAGWLDQIISVCKESDLPFATFIDISENPKDIDVVRGCRTYLENECDSIIGLGGGSALDAAKAISILATNGGEISGQAVFAIIGTIGWSTRGCPAVSPKPGPITRFGIRNF